MTTTMEKDRKPFGLSFMFYFKYLFIAMLIMGGFYYAHYYISPETSGKILQYIPVVTLIVFLINCLIAMENFKQQSEERLKSEKLQNMGLTQGKITDIDKIFMNDPKLDRLYFQIYKNDPAIKKISKNVAETPDILKAEHHMANIMFQKIEDICNSQNLNTKEDITKCNKHLVLLLKTWMASDILRKHWEVLKFEHSPNTIEFVDTVLLVKK